MALPLQKFPKIKCLILQSTTSSGLSISVTLLEQAIFVNASLSLPCVLRGCVELTVSKTVELRNLAIKFRGVNKLRKFSHYGKEECIIDCTWPIPQLEARGNEINRVNTTNRVLQPKKGADGQDTWPILNPGKYAYDFELTVNQFLPETFNVGGCRLKYKIQVSASGSGFRRQLSQPQEVPVVHCPRDVQLHLHEANQICLSRIWNRQISYSLELSNKSAPIGGNVPIAVRIGRSDILYVVVQVFLGQKIKFPGIPGKQAQLRKKLLLKSQCKDLSTGKFDDKLPYLNLDQDSGTTVIAGHVPLLDEPNGSLRLHPDVNFKNVKATHMMMFLIDITIPNSKASDSQKSTICRLTAETPFRIRSPHTQNYDSSVPQYTESHEDLAIDCNSLLPPPFSASRSSPQLSRPIPNSVDSEDFELSSSRQALSPCLRPHSWTPVCHPTSVDFISPPPAYESIL